MLASGASHRNAQSLARLICAMWTRWHKQHLAILLTTVSQALRTVCGMQWALNKHMWKVTVLPFFQLQTRLQTSNLVPCP